MWEITLAVALLLGLLAFGITLVALLTKEAVHVSFSVWKLLQFTLNVDKTNPPVDPSSSSSGTKNVIVELLRVVFATTYSNLSPGWIKRPGCRVSFIARRFGISLCSSACYNRGGDL
jgi:hypothetical protein